MSLEGLKAYRESKEKRASSGKYLWIGDGDKIKIRPLQELDPDSKNYSSKNGLARFTKEWSNPQDYTRVIVDTTEEEGACVGPELLREYGWGDTDNPGWRPKERMYLNVLVDDGENDPHVEILQCNIGGRSVQGPALIDHSDNNDNHSVTDRWWTYSRTGKGTTDTTYKLTPGDRDDSLPSVEKFDLLDIEESLPKVPYANQEAALGVQAWKDRYGQEVLEATAKKAGKLAPKAATAERAVSQNTEW